MVIFLLVFALGVITSEVSATDVDLGQIKESTPGPRTEDRYEEANQLVENPDGIDRHSGITGRRSRVYEGLVPRTYEGLKPVSWLKYECPKIVRDSGHCNHCYAIVFGSKSCRYCPKMYPVINMLRKNGYIVFYIDTGDYPGIFNRFNLRVWPTTVVMEHRKQKKRFEGVVDADTISKYLKTREQQGIK